MKFALPKEMCEFNCKTFATDGKDRPVVRRHDSRRLKCTGSERSRVPPSSRGLEKDKTTAVRLWGQAEPLKVFGLLQGATGKSLLLH